MLTTYQSRSPASVSATSPLVCSSPSQTPVSTQRSTSPLPSALTARPSVRPRRKPRRSSSRTKRSKGDSPIKRILFFLSGYGRGENSPYNGNRTYKETLNERVLRKPQARYCRQSHRRPRSWSCLADRSKQVHQFCGLRQEPRRLRRGDEERRQENQVVTAPDEKPKPGFSFFVNSTRGLTCTSFPPTAR